MFIVSLATLGLAATAFATPMKRDESLAVELTVSQAKVASVKEIAVVAKVTNTGTEDVRILKYGTVLDTLPTRSFVVTKDGSEVPFTGIKIQFDIEKSTEQDYAVIPAGKSVSVTHKVAEAYDFAKAGVGSFTFAPANNFKVSPTSAKFASFDSYDAVPAPSTSVIVEVTDDVENAGIYKRAVVSCSNASRASFISASYTEAKELGRIASSWISSNSGSTLYRAYWKTNTPSSVQAKFNAAVNENSSVRTMGCVDTAGACGGGTIAYTFVAAPQNMVFCPIFFNEVPSTRLCSGTTVASRNVRGGTTLHELTHAVANTDDVVYGCASDQALSAANQLRNADNYNCFATQVYQNTRC